MDNWILSSFIVIELFPEEGDEKYRDVVFDDTDRADDLGDCRRVIEAIVVVAAAAKLAEVPSRCTRAEE